MFILGYMKIRQLFEGDVRGGFGVNEILFILGYMKIRQLLQCNPRGRTN